MEEVVGAGLEPSDPCGYFRISFEHDSLKQDVRESLVGIGVVFCM